MSTDVSHYRAVLFDFDGTLADGYQGITASVNHVRAAHHLPPLSEAEVRKHVGRGPLQLLQATVPRSDPATDVPLYRAHHPTVMREGTRLLPGAAEALATLKTAGKLLAVCSNKPRIYTDELLRYLRVAEFFDQVIGPEDVSRPKPAPDMLLTALQRLGIPKAEALYVGDMTIDIETARAAGIRVWIVPTGSDDRAKLEQAQPDRLLRDLGELAELLGRP